MNRNTSLPIVLLLFAALLAGCSAAPPQPPCVRAPIFEQRDVFLAHTDGYHTSRIPSLLTTPRGTLLAFCEGRKNSADDSGDIDILLKRSTDNGRTWSPAQLVADHGPDTIGNPCPVIDGDTGAIWLLLTGNPGQDREAQITAGAAKGTRTVWLSHSDDDGHTWSTPADITASVKPHDWTWYATGPGCGIQLRTGRLVVPCDHSLPGPAKIRRSHVIYSDDHGRTWCLGGVVKENVNECQVVELTDGALMLNMRNYAKGRGRQNRRAVAISRDAGLTWSAPTYAPDLIEPVCQAAFIRFPPRPGDPRNLLLFSNPASTKRVNMTVRVSSDEGQTWPIARQIHAGPSAYSALAILPDRTIGLLYERGDTNPYEKITFARFSPEWLTARTTASVPTPGD